MINFSSHFIGRCVSSRFVGKVGLHAEPEIDFSKNIFTLAVTGTWIWERAETGINGMYHIIQKTFHTAAEQAPGAEWGRENGLCIIQLLKLVVHPNCVSMAFRSPVTIQVRVSVSNRSRSLCEPVWLHHKMALYHPDITTEFWTVDQCINTMVSDDENL